MAQHPRVSAFFDSFWPLGLHAGGLLVAATLQVNGWWLSVPVGVLAALILPARDLWDRRTKGEAVLGAREEVVGWARTIARGDDLKTICELTVTTVSPHFLPGRKVRVGVYLLEKGEDEDSSDQGGVWGLKLYGEKSSGHHMSEQVTEKDDKQACRDMVARARGRKTLVVPDVTKSTAAWRAVQDTAEQRGKYMSFVSVPIYAHVENPKGPPAGLLCVDSKDVGGMGEDDVQAVNALASLLGIGLDTTPEERPQKPSGMPG